MHRVWVSGPVLLLLTGCLTENAPPPSGQTQASTDSLDDPAPTNSPTASLDTTSLRWNGNQNFSVLWAFEATQHIAVSGGAAWDGPKSSGFTAALIRQNAPPLYLAKSWDIPEFSKAKRISGGVFEEQCWSGKVRRSTSDEPCELRQVPRPDLTWRIDTDVPPGSYQLFVSAEFESNFTLDLTFSKPVRLGPPQEIDALPIRIGAESFDATSEDISRCQNVGNGVFDLSKVSTNHTLFYIIGSSGNGRLVNSCLRESSGEKCPEQHLIGGGFGFVFAMDEYWTAHAPRELVFQVTGAPHVGVTASGFMVRGIVHNLPHH